MEIDYTQILNNISTDARDLMRSYLNSINQVFIGKNINPQQKSEVFNGIFAYIDEFIDERDGRQLSFNETISLIDRLGSPSEILQSMNLNEVTEMEVPGVFYHPGRSKLQQGIIDHPYAFGFLISYFVFISIGLAWESNQTTGPFIDVFFRIMGTMLFPSIVFGLIIGYFISKVYETEISLEVKQKKLVEEYTEPAEIVFVFTFVIGGPTSAGYFIVMSGVHWGFGAAGGILLALSFASLPLLLVLVVGEGPKPDEMSYHVLLRHKKTIMDEITTDIKSKIHAIIITALAAIISWIIIVNIIVDHPSIVQIIVPSISIGILFALLSFAYITFWANSWKRMRNKIEILERHY
ncbi:MAG: hypothetical protein INQ03_16465 [Candidatus Heimdallarchaeota archaeon]|nr:hypothetical protein [Candidatus Heimdallarchaeota archaeon]